jgi:geranylgeranyl pyrophosphate synthase
MSDITTKTFPAMTLVDPLDERLWQVEALLDVQVADEYSSLALALQHMIRAGGKRIRPRLVLLTGSLLGSDLNRLVRLAAAVEMLHTASLVHDDLVDGSILRRGMETLNVKWSPAATVLAGDFAFTRAAQLAASTDSTAVMSLFAESMAVMVDGELAHLLREGGIASREAYYRWISAKTAALFELSTGAAALLSQAGEDAVAAARRFGHEIGMAFQIMDDVLDFTGDPAVLGKPVGSDLRQGVVTLPALYYLESHPDDPILRSLAAHQRADEPDLARLLGAIRQNGAIQLAVAEARDFVQRGLAALEHLPDGPECLGLERIAWAIIEREN